MHEERDAMMLVQAELCEKLAALQRFGCQTRPSELADNVIALRTLAATYGFTPAARVAEALERAMAMSPRAGSCPTALYLDRIQDAIGCGRSDEQASEAYLASISVRLVA
jgi:hypothetical protein